MRVEHAIDYRAWSFWFNVAQVIGYLILGIYVWSSNRDKVKAAEIKEVKDTMQALKDAQSAKCAEHLKRTTILEGSVKGLPTHRDLGEVYDKINGVKSTVDEISGSMTGVVFQLKLLVKHHLKGSG
jgi:hypothetical protein